MRNRLAVLNARNYLIALFLASCYNNDMRTCRVCGMPNTVLTNKGPATCPKCRREKYLIVKRRYQKSPKGQATTSAREQREDVKEKRRRFSASKRGIENSIKYRKTIKGKLNAQKRSANYRKRLYSAEGEITIQQWMEILERHNYRCYYCKKRRFKLTLDHVIPLSKGGKNIPENIVPACRSCNAKKKDKLILLY